MYFLKCSCTYDKVGSTACVVSCVLREGQSNSKSDVTITCHLDLVTIRRTNQTPAVIPSDLETNQSRSKHVISRTKTHKNADNFVYTHLTFGMGLPDTLQTNVASLPSMSWKFLRVCSKTGGAMSWTCLKASLSLT